MLSKNLKMFVCIFIKIKIKNTELLTILVLNNGLQIVRL